MANDRTPPGPFNNNSHPAGFAWDIAASGPFPIVADYPFGRLNHPEVAIHQFGSGNAKIEQRFLLGAGARRYTVRRAFLRDSDRRALRDFWELK